jgi:uncharacterized protein YdaU (DUF1376 family)
MASKADTWMPFYVADYLKDTMHLTRDQHGGYMLLLMACWNRGGRLPNVAGQLAGMAKATPSEWRKLSPVLLPFFEIEGGELVHGRVVEEHEKAARLSEIRRENGGKGGRPPKQIETGAKASGLAKPKLTETPSPSPLPVISEANASSSSAKPDDVKAAFEIWNEAAQRLGLPRAEKLTERRRRDLRARLAEGGMPRWRAAIRAVEASKFCRGLKGDFRADLDFVLQSRSFQRLLEGSYGQDCPVLADDGPKLKFDGPPELRARLLDASSEGFVSSYVDQANFISDGNVLEVLTRTAAEKLQEKCGHVLRDLNVRLQVKSPAQVAHDRSAA